MIQGTILQLGRIILEESSLELIVYWNMQEEKEKYQNFWRKKFGQIFVCYQNSKEHHKLSEKGKKEKECRKGGSLHTVRVINQIVVRDKMIHNFINLTIYFYFRSNSFCGLINLPYTGKKVGQRDKSYRVIHRYPYKKYKEPNDGLSYVQKLPM